MKMYVAYVKFNNFVTNYEKYNIFSVHCKYN